MTTTDWICAAFGGAAAALAHHYYERCKRLTAALLDLRIALRERDAAEREPMKAAFQAGFKIGMAASGQDPTDIDVVCDCEKCRGPQQWTVN